MEKEFLESLYDIGNACGKIAKDITELHKNLEEVLFVVPLRGGLPIWIGVRHGLYKLLGPFEVDVLFLPASSIVEKRREIIKEKISSLLRKSLKKYKTIIIVDEAVSGSSSKMVWDAVKEGVKNCKTEKEWKRTYWKEISIELYDVVANQGKRFDARIQKLGNVLIYPIPSNIVTTDNSYLYPLEYISEIRRLKGKDGRVYKLVSPDIFFKKNKNWNSVVKWIEKGVEGYLEEVKGYVEEEISISAY